MGEYADLKRSVQDQMTSIVREFERTTGCRVDAIHITDPAHREIGILPQTEVALEVRMPI
jgi:hypothetical protein